MSDVIRHSIKDDRWHILNKIGMYLGSSNRAEYNEYMVSAGKMEIVKISYVPAVIKMINEIIDNSIDVLKNKKSGKIDVTITDFDVTVRDNGDGIPIQHIKDLDGSDVLIPYSCWGKAKAGSNFNDDDIDATTIGTNGVGSYCSNVHSSRFVGTTCDGKQEYVGIWTDNALNYEEKVKPKKSKGTSVTFTPRLETFKLERIDNQHKQIIEQRLMNLSVVYPNLAFSFNGKVIKLSRKQYLQMFSQEGNIYEEEHYAIGVFPSVTDDFQQFSIINGLNIKGGNHIEYLLKYVITEIKEKLPKKFSDIKVGDIKNKLQIVMVGNEFPSIQWEGQTKETIGNSNKEVRAYLGENWKDFLIKIAKNKAITDPITFLHGAKLDAQERLDALKVDKILKNANVQKLRKASKQNKFLFLSEGDSALKGIIKALGRIDKSYYPLKGVPANPYTSTLSKIMSNAEYKDIMSILKLKFSESNKLADMDYDYVVMATDADVDGSHIAGLLMGFFWKFCPEVITEKRLLLLRTPIKVAKDKKEKMTHAFVTAEEFIKFEAKGIPKGTEIEYKKGLGSMNDKEYKQFFELRPLEDCLVSLDYQEEDIKTMLSWVGDDSDFRKDGIQKRLKHFDADTI